jgi:hypothetical protein
MPVMRIITDVVDAHVDQTTLTGALKYAGFKVGGENFRQERKHLELHGGILPLVSRMCHVKVNFLISLYTL